MEQSGDSKDYIKMIVFVFVMFGSFLIAMLSAYFSGVGLYFGQGIVESEVWADYRFECTNLSQSASDCTQFNTSASTQAYQNYEAFTNTINPLIINFLTATTIIFSLLALVFLFLALKSAGLWGSNKKKEDNI